MGGGGGNVGLGREGDCEVGGMYVLYESSLTITTQEYTHQHNHTQPQPQPHPTPPKHTHSQELNKLQAEVKTFVATGGENNPAVARLKEEVLALQREKNIAVADVSRLTERLERTERDISVCGFCVECVCMNVRDLHMLCVL